MKNLRGSRIPDTVRHAVVASFEARGPKWTAIAREHGISDQSARNIVQEAGLWVPGRPDPNLETATEYRLQRARALRSELSVELLELAKASVEQWRQPAKVYKFGGRDNTYAEHQLEEPDFTAKQQLANAIGALVDRALALERHDAGQGEESRGALISLVENLQEPA